MRVCIAHVVCMRSDVYTPSEEAPFVEREDVRRDPDEGKVAEGDGGDGDEE